MADRDYDDWEPPSEYETKLIQARRERSNKISKLMGDYLLKGYKMLATTCRECDTILLQTKQGANYCIACSELDSDADKDDPVTNQAAAMALAREREVIATPARLPESKASSSQASTHSTSAAATAPREHPKISSTMPSETVQGQRNQGVNASVNAAGHVSYTDSCGRGNVVLKDRGTAACGDWTQNFSRGVGELEGEKYVKALLDKMDWTVGELRETRDVDYSIKLCQLIKSCAEAVSSTRAAFE